MADCVFRNLGKSKTISQIDDRRSQLDSKDGSLLAENAFDVLELVELLNVDYFGGQLDKGRTVNILRNCIPESRVLETYQVHVQRSDQLLVDQSGLNIKSQRVHFEPKSSFNKESQP